VFLVRLGASHQVACSRPCGLTGMLLSIPIGEFCRGARHIVPWFARSRFAVLICYVLTGLVPFFVPSRPRPGVMHLAVAICRRPWYRSVSRRDGGCRGAGRPSELDEPSLVGIGTHQLSYVLIVGQIFQFSTSAQLPAGFIGSGIGALISVVMSSTCGCRPCLHRLRLAI